jgi:hypothetical protein
MTTPHGSDPRNAFEDLYRSTCDALLRYLVRRCRDAEEAADLFAETYLTAGPSSTRSPTGRRRSCGCSGSRAISCYEVPVVGEWLTRSSSDWQKGRAPLKPRRPAAKDTTRSGPLSQNYLSRTEKS